MEIEATFASARRILAVCALAALLPFVVNLYSLGGWIIATATVVAAGLLAAASFIGSPAVQQRILQFGFVPASAAIISVATAQYGPDRALWAFPLIAATSFLMSGRSAWFWTAVVVCSIGTTVVVAYEPLLGLRFAATLGLVGAIATVATSKMEQLLQHLHHLAHTDPLTGLRNRTELLAVVRRAVEQRHEHGVRASAVSIDIDRFKLVNDTYGHDVGDHVLARVARSIRNSMPETAIVFRTGGDEFLCILPGTPRDGAAAFAEALRDQVESDDRLPVDVTLSMGVAEVREDDDATTWLYGVDRHLYTAKEGGRNTVASGERPNAPRATDRVKPPSKRSA